MTDLKIDRDLGAKILGALSILALAAGLVFLLWPKQSAAAMSRAEDKQVADLMKKEQDAKTARDGLEKLNKARTWACPQAEIGPSALAFVTHLAKTHRLKLATFRPQKSVELKGLTELPFLMAVEGSYLDIADVLRELEKPESKLVPAMLQLAAGDQSSDKVTASITVAAFAEPQPAVKAGTQPTSKTGTRPSAKAGAKSDAQSAAKSGAPARRQAQGGTNGKAL